MVSKKPKIVEDIGFNFDWDIEKVWKLDVPVVQMDIEDLIWHFDIPFFDKDGTDDWNLTPWEVIKKIEGTMGHQTKVNDADLKYPIDIMENKGRLLILDGLHRLVKAHTQGLKQVDVRIIPREKIPEILIVKN